MNITITTHINGTPAILAGQVQYEDEFTVAIYQRAGLDIPQYTLRFFSAEEGGGMTWNGHRLSIHSPERKDMPRINVDLIWNKDAQTWSGLFERGSFKERVLLKHRSSVKAASPFVGTWSEESGIANNCIHIEQEADGAFAVWSDDLYSLYGVRYAKGIEPFKTTREHYGELGKGDLQAPDLIALELRAYTAGCCSYPFTAKISADHQSLVVPLETPIRTTWRRMPGTSCLSKRPFAAP